MKPPPSPPVEVVLGPCHEFDLGHEWKLKFAKRIGELGFKSSQYILAIKEKIVLVTAEPEIAKKIRSEVWDTHRVKVWSDGRMIGEIPICEVAMRKKYGSVLAHSDREYDEVMEVMNFNVTAEEAKQAEEAKKVQQAEEATQAEEAKPAEEAK